MVSFFPDINAPLPDTPSLVISGTYHDSAPLSLALSYVERDPEGDVLVLSSFRELFAESMRDYATLRARSLSPSDDAVILCSRVHIMYPRTPLHFSFFLSNMQVANVGNSTGNLNAKTTWDAPPCAIILHELSHYFLSGEEEESCRWTVSSYLSLVTEAMSAASFLSPESITPVVLFDSQLNNMKLPVTRALPMKIEQDDDAAIQPPQAPLLMDVIRNIFHTVVVFNRAAPPFRFTLSRNGKPVQTWCWTEDRDEAGLLVRRRDLEVSSAPSHEALAAVTQSHLA